MSAQPVEDSSLRRLRALLLEEGGLIASLVKDSADGPPPADVLSPDTQRDSAAQGGGPTQADGSMQADGSTQGGPTQADGSMGGGGPTQPEGPAQLAASGPRVSSYRDEYELLLETIYEGYLLHYDTARVLRPGEEDLGLLAGDRLYALGLTRLVGLGDVEGVAELADVITLSALAHGSSQPELAEAIWMAGARAIGWGSDPRHERAKAMVRDGSPEALGALRAFVKVEP